MGNSTKIAPIDTKLLNDLIIEFTISFRNVSIYPKGHPIVENSLKRAFNFLNKLFEFREELSLAIANDTIIFDSHYLDRENPVYRRFSLFFSKVNIAYMTFIRGLKKDELYSFNRFVLSAGKKISNQNVMDTFKEYNLPHISIESVDFSAFCLVEGATEKENNKESLWEKYIYALFEGKVRIEDASDIIQEIPAEKLAKLINRAAPDNVRRESYDRVISSYIRKSTEKKHWGKELNNLVDIINNLRPNLKQQFLSSACSALSSDIDSIDRSFKDLSVEEATTLMKIINEQKVAIPETLKNVLDKFSIIHRVDPERRHSQDVITDNDSALLSQDVQGLFMDMDYDKYVPPAYQSEIQRILKSESDGAIDEIIEDIEDELADDNIERVFNHVLLELFMSGNSTLIPQEEFSTFMDILNDQLKYFMDTCQYKRILETIRMLEAGGGSDPLDAACRALRYLHSPRFMACLVRSFRIMIKDMQDDILHLCEYYNEDIIPELIYSLKNESSSQIRKSLIYLITTLGERAVPEVEKHLDDARWFVKRNMLYILYQCGSSYSVEKIRPHCSHGNSKVRFLALKCLLKVRDSYGVDLIRGHLKQESGDLFRKALTLSGTFRLTEVVPDLIKMFRKKAVTGSDFEKKIPIVKALGRIGGPRALECLRRFLTTRSILFSSSLNRLKKEIQGTLKRCARRHAEYGDAAADVSRERDRMREETHVWRQ